MTAALKVISTLTVAGPMRELGAAFEAASGVKLDAEFGPTVLLTAKIKGGAAADLVMLTKEQLDVFAREGVVRPDTARDLVRSYIGVGVKAGAPKPRIGTVGEFTAALRTARKICYSRAGASGLHFAALIRRLGIEAEVNAKAIIIPEGFTGEAASRGEADLAIQQVSELMAVPGVDIVGRFPDEIGRAALFSAGVLASSPRAADALRLIDYLASPAAAPVLRRYGLDPMG